MKIQATLCALATLASVASATSVVTATVNNGTIAVLLGSKLLALKGVLIGRAVGKRSSETLEEIFLEASRKDQYDCAKLLICELSATPAQQLKVIILCFNTNINIDNCLFCKQILKIYLELQIIRLNSGQMKLASQLHIFLSNLSSLLTCSSDQTLNPESTNPEFISPKLLFVFD